MLRHCRRCRRHRRHSGSGGSHRPSRCHAYWTTQRPSGSMQNPCSTKTPGRWLPLGLRGPRQWQVLQRTRKPALLPRCRTSNHVNLCSSTFSCICKFATGWQLISVLAYSHSRTAVYLQVAKRQHTADGLAGLSSGVASSGLHQRSAPRGSAAAGQDSICGVELQTSCGLRVFRNSCQNRLHSL